MKNFSNIENKLDITTKEYVDNIANKKQDNITETNKLAISLVDGIENYQKIGSGVCYDTSTSDTAGTWTVTIPNITALTEGLTVKVRLKTSYNSTLNTLNVNGLGAKTVYFRYGTKLTSHYAKESVLALTYTATAIGSGTDTSGWIVENIYDSTNTYQLRTYNTRPKTKSALYRYMICFVNNDGLLIPANNTSNSTATTKTLTTESFNLFDSIYYYNSTTTISANGQVGTGTLYKQLSIDLRYSFNTGTTLVAPNGVYLKVTADGSQFKLATDTPVTQSLPTSDDGYFYCYLGRAYSTYQIELAIDHPIYLYKNGVVQEYATYAKGTAETALSKSPTALGGGAVIPGSEGVFTQITLDQIYANVFSNKNALRQVFNRVESGQMLVMGMVSDGSSGVFIQHITGTVENEVTSSDSTPYEGNNKGVYHFIIGEKVTSEGISERVVIWAEKSGTAYSDYHSASQGTTEVFSTTVSEGWNTEYVNTETGLCDFSTLVGDGQVYWQLIQTAVLRADLGGTPQGNYFFAGSRFSIEYQSQLMQTTVLDRALGGDEDDGYFIDSINLNPNFLRSWKQYQTETAIGATITFNTKLKISTIGACLYRMFNNDLRSNSIVRELSDSFVQFKIIPIISSSADGNGDWTLCAIQLIINSTTLYKIGEISYPLTATDPLGNSELVFDGTAWNNLSDTGVWTTNADDRVARYINFGALSLLHQYMMFGQYNIIKLSLKDMLEAQGRYALSTVITAHQDISGKLSKTENTGVSVLGTTKATTTLGGNQLVAPNGIIIAGSAANAGLTTRGVCGVSTPDSKGACAKENLYINYDNTDTFNAGRQLVLQAGSVGTHYGNNLYQYAVPRGDIVKAWVEAKGYLTSHQDISGKANLAGGNTFSGLQTINAPTDVSGSETTTLKAKTSNGGAIIFGKEGANSGTMIRLDQADGTCRLRFRGSSTAGAMVWEQPEEGAQLYVDLGKNGSDKHRVSFPSSAGTLALTSQIPTVNNGTLTIQKNGTNVQTFTANQSSSVTANITVPTKTSELTNDSGYLTSHQDISDKANLNGGNTFSGKQTMPIVETGSDASNYFQCRKFRGEGDASTYYHAIDFGYPSHDQVDFYEYGGVYNFWKNTSSSATSDENNLCLQIGQTGLKNKANTFTFPSKSGTFAMTSDIPDVSGKANLSDVNNFTDENTFTDANGKTTINGSNVTMRAVGAMGSANLTVRTDNNNTIFEVTSDAENGAIYLGGTLNIDDDAGVSGQVLTSQGDGKTPQWTSIPTYSLSGTTLTITLP